MDSNLDPFDDILHDSTSNCARPGGKFQPRTKFQPLKATAAPVASALPSNATEKAITPPVSSLDTNKLVQSVDTAEDGLTGTVSSEPASSAGTREPLKNNYDNTTVVSAEEADSSVFNLYQLDDIICTSATGHAVGPATKFQPRAITLPTEVTAATVDPPTLSSYVVREADVPSPTGLDTTNTVQPIDSGDVRNTRPVGSSLASSMGVKVPLERNIETFGVADEAGSSAFGLDPSDEQNPNIALNLGHNMPPNLTSLEFPVEEEQTAVAEVSHLDNMNIVHEKDSPGVPKKKTLNIKKKRAASDSKLPTKSKKSSIAIEMGEGGKSSRKLRKRATTTQLVDEQEDGALAEPASSSGTDEDDEDYEFTFEDRDDDNNIVESASKKKRASQKSMKPVGEKERPVRKRKKANDTAGQSTKKPPKKISHSTRRKKRHVNKDLLNMPEDEIDYSSLAIKDIIFLAEHKEKLAVKEAKASLASSKTSLTNQSNERYSSGIHSQDEQDPFNSELGGGQAYNEENTIQAASLLYNAHSFMNRPPTVRWTKQDTELFYEGIRNFGTDLSLIQQLFPGRTRRQMYLKLKKEQRQHPLKLSEAENNRPKDHSYFMRLIKQQQAEKESNKNDIFDVSGEDEDELKAETTEQVAKSELEADVKGSKPLDSAEIDEVSVEEEEEEDSDNDVWGTYGSDF